MSRTPIQTSEQDEETTRHLERIVLEISACLFAEGQNRQHIAPAADSVICR